MYGCYGVLIDLCKVDGEIPFLTASSVLLTEILKLFICLLVLLAQYKVHLLPLLTWKVVLPFSLPALCYAVNNNLAVFMQTQMDPATYMVGIMLCLLWDCVDSIVLSYICIIIPITQAD
uniref:Uncharacterized protein n=1 Tax=Biomphalaria glabrata TaxID=6526 RepID=A0A2C9KQU6_BIOGL